MEKRRKREKKGENRGKKGNHMEKIKKLRYGERQKVVAKDLKGKSFLQIDEERNECIVRIYAPVRL